MLNPVGYRIICVVEDPRMSLQWKDQENSRSVSCASWSHITNEWCHC